ncbi:MAG: GGDEF domain-containing protein, partial [Candidatus Saccharimonadales bacterium]
MLPNDRGFEAPDLSIDLRDVPSVGLEPPTEAKLENIDHLTGLHNRRWLDAALAQEITNNPGGFSLLFIDLDGLKTINDKRGHAAGDSHIRTSAEAISQCLRNSTEHDKRLSRPKDDIAEGVVRVGGDEFVVLLRGVSDQSTVDSIQSRIH